MVDVRYWHLADIAADAEDVFLLGVKRTSLIRYLMSANDPKRTIATTVEMQTNAHCALNCRPCNQSESSDI